MYQFDDRVFEFIARTEGRYWAAVFLLTILAYTLAMVYAALGYSAVARLFPLVVAAPVIAMIVVKVFLLVFPDRFDIQSAELFQNISQMATRTEQSVDPILRYKREFAMGLWVGGFLVLTWLVGLLVALLVFVFAFIYFYERNLPRALIATAATGLFVYVLFLEVLDSTLYEGLYGGGLL